MKITLLSTLAVCGLAAPAIAAKPTERRLHTDQVEASSFLWNDWSRFQENYHPNYVGDDDPKTAWTEGAKSSGAGEWIRIRITELADTSKVRLRIRNGYQKSKKLFAANGRAKEVTVKLLPSGKLHKLTLADRDGWQEVAIDQPNGPIGAVEVAVGSVYEGTKYDDLCISDIQVFATSATRENPSFEKSKRKKLLGWKAERLKAAKLYKRSSSKQLPLSASYRFDATEVQSSTNTVWEACQMDWVCHTRKALELARKDKDFNKHWGPDVAVALTAIADDMPGFVPAKIASTDKRPIPAVDGVYVPELYYAVEGAWGYSAFELPIVGGIGSLRAETVRPLEIKQQQKRADVLAAKAPGCTRTEGKTYSWLLRNKQSDGRETLRALFVVQCGRVEVRDGSDDVSQLQVIVYGSDGKLALIAGPGYVDGYTWQGEVVAGGRAIYADGRRATLTRGEVAAR